MPRKARVLSGSGIYHLIWRGIDKQQLFTDDADNLRFLSLLDFVQNKHFEILGYCLMGNHVHLLVRTKKESMTEMEQTMRRIGVRYASYYNRRYQRTGPIFQGRYKSQPVETVSYFLRVLRYIHYNPVSAGICEDMADYVWSSYRDYFTDSRGFCDVHIKYALQLRDRAYLEEWHKQKEHNILAFAENENAKKMSDKRADEIILAVCGCNPLQLWDLEEARRSRFLRHLVVEEGIRIAQLSRLTGIARGIIQRCVN